VLAIRRGPGQRRPLAILAAPFRIDRAAPFALVRRPAVVVFVSDPERAPRTPPEHLAELYGLTPRESALVALLLDGCDLREAAGRLGVSMNTVRTHMRLVLEKTGTHRQAELVSLLLRSVVTLQRPETQP
jgi:DNA-binding CsgD family transcriptional regulator